VDSVDMMMVNKEGKLTESEDVQRVEKEAEKG